MKRNRKARLELKLCGVPLLDRVTSRARQNAAARDLRSVALRCPDFVAREIVKAAREEHRQATQPDRALLKDVRDRGGVCFPGGMSPEEWRNRLPRALHGKRGRCVPPDELAQELYDRGVIAEPTLDVVLDHLGERYAQAKTPPPIPDERDLKRVARRLVAERVSRAVRELVRSAQREAESACPPPSGGGGER